MAVTVIRGRGNLANLDLYLALDLKTVAMAETVTVTVAVPASRICL